MFGTWAFPLTTNGMYELKFERVSDSRGGQRTVVRRTFHSKFDIHIMYIYYIHLSRSDDMFFIKRSSLFPE